MASLYLACVFVAILTVIRADYECLCNYNVFMSVYREPSNNSEVIGTLSGFDCKPTYRTYHPSILWMAVQYQKQVGYVAYAHGVKVQTCPGQPFISDTVVITPMAFKPSTSNRPSTSKSTKVTSTTTRMCTSWISYCDYECLCNYHIETAVYSGPKTSGGKIGSMHEFDCKPTYHMVPSSRRWQAIQYQKQVGYVALDDLSKVQMCPGPPSRRDLVQITKGPQSTSTVAFIAKSQPTASSTSRPTVAPSSTRKAPTTKVSSPTTPIETSIVTRLRTYVSILIKFPSTATSRPRSRHAVQPSTAHSTAMALTTSSSGVYTIAASTSSTPSGSSPTVTTAPDLDDIRRMSASSLSVATGATTPSSPAEQSPNECINEPQYLSKGFDKGTVAGMVLAAFLAGLFGGAMAVWGYLKLRAKPAGKYEVLFENGSVNQKTVLHVK